MQLPSPTNEHELVGDANSSSAGGGLVGNTDPKIIETKTICYCSNFDLNINEWFNEYENIEIFKLNMKKNLGK